MARPVLSLSAGAVKNGIVTAAMKVFAKRGFAATRVEDILEASDVARRTFYKYFDSKEDVLAALYELTTGELLKFLEAAVAGASDPLEGIRLGVDVYLDFHVENAALLRVLVEQAIRSDSPIAPARRRFRDALVDLLARAAAARGKKGLDAYTYIGLISALEGISLELLEKGAPAREVTRAKHAVHAMLDRVLAPER